MGSLCFIDVSMPRSIPNLNKYMVLTRCWLWKRREYSVFWHFNRPKYYKYIVFQHPRLPKCDKQYLFLRFCHQDRSLSGTNIMFSCIQGFRGAESILSSSILDFQSANGNVCSCIPEFPSDKSKVWIDHTSASIFNSSSNITSYTL